MKEKDIQMKSEVMKRVTSIHYMRTAVRPFLTRTGALLLFIAGTFSLVSVPDVITNLMGYNGNYFTYIMDAFVHTNLSVQLILAITSVLFLWVTMDILRNLKHIRKFSFN